MTPGFEYIMALMAIILGLGVAHVLSGYGQMIYRATGHGSPIRFDWVHFLWSVLTFQWMVSYWWYSFSSAAQIEWTLTTYLAMLPFPVVLYLQCVILFPHRFDEVEDLRAYFMSTRKWYFALLLIATVTDLFGLLFPGGAEAAAQAAQYYEAIGWSLWIAVGYTGFVGVLGILTENARVHVALAVSAVVVGVWQQFNDHPVLGALLG